MNKKILLVGLPVLLLIGLVAAASYYGIFTTTIEVQPSVIVSGNLVQDLGTVYSGEVVRGDEITIQNDAPSERTITITEDSNGDIDVSYVSELGLTQKIVDFGADVWLVDPEGDTANVEYTVIGDSFTAEIIDGEKEGYTLIYYKDNSDRHSSPAKAILISEVVGNLPYVDDANADEYDYCATGEYQTCHGAKLWYVPSDAINPDKTVDWSRASEFLYETFLIQYNADGELVLYSGTSIVLTPVYNVGNYASGNYTITTTVA